MGMLVKALPLDYHQLNATIRSRGQKPSQNPYVLPNLHTF